MGAGASKLDCFGSKASKKMAAGQAAVPGQPNAAPLTTVPDKQSSIPQPQSEPAPAKVPLPHTAFKDGEFAGAPHPLSEEPRMEYLCGLNVLDTAPEQRFDDITKLACMIFKVPIALVSLVDKDRQWFKSVQGLSVTQTDRKSSFCAWTLLPQEPEVLVVSNALEDARFAVNPLVTGPPDIRFYAGCPLVASNKLRLGSLCIIDREPRVFDAESCMMLANLAEMVVREIEKDQQLSHQRQMSSQLKHENTQLLRAIDSFTEGCLLVNVSEPGWSVEFINDAWEQLTGFKKEHLGQPFLEFFRPIDRDMTRLQGELASAIAEQTGFELSVSFKDGSGQTRAAVLHMQCANTENMDSYMPLIGIPSILPATPAPGTIMPTYYFATLGPSQFGDQSGTLNSCSNSMRHGSGASSLTPASGKALLATPNTDPFGDVKLGQLLGRGSYGRVYRGRWNGAQVAVKVLEYETDEGEQKEQMEALLSTQLSHPNVVQTFKHCSREMGRSHQGNSGILETWMVMEFCNKGSLSDAVDLGAFRQKGALFQANFTSLLQTAKEIASAMCYLHNLGILHGDLSAGNVLLSGSEKDERKFMAKVADFGLSRVLDGQDSLQTATIGTVTHMPPELLLDGVMSRAGDVYAFGVLMWEMYMGQRPWSGMSHGQIITAISMGKQLQLSAGCPPKLQKFMFSCMAPKPADRPTFQDILHQLDGMEDDLVDAIGDL